MFKASFLCSHHVSVQISGFVLCDRRNVGTITCKYGFRLVMLISSYFYIVLKVCKLVYHFLDAANLSDLSNVQMFQLYKLNVCKLE